MATVMAEDELERAGGTMDKGEEGFIDAITANREEILKSVRRKPRKKGAGTQKEPGICR